MFEVPNAKRVRRSELHNSSSRSASPASDQDGDASSREAAQAALASFFSSRFGDLDESRPTDNQPAGGKLESGSTTGTRKQKTKRNSKAKSKPRSSSAEPSSSSEADGSDAEGVKDDDAEEAPNEPPSYSFRLFATPSGTAHANTNSTEDGSTVEKPKGDSKDVSSASNTHQIILEPLDADLSAAQAGSDGGIVHRRPLSYYLATPWSASQLSAASSVCLSGDDVLSESRRRWPGCAVPWRVRTVRVGKKGREKLAEWSLATQPLPSGLSSDPQDPQKVHARLVGPDGRTLVPDERTRRRPKPGKKTRIAKRKRIQAALEKKRQAELDAEEKAREKTRKNREKKVRRKLKLKEKGKETAAGDADGAGSGPADPTESTGPSAVLATD